MKFTLWEVFQLLLYSHPVYVKPRVPEQSWVQDWVCRHSISESADSSSDLETPARYLRGVIKTVIGDDILSLPFSLPTPISPSPIPLTLAIEFRTDVTLGWWGMHRSEGFSNAMTAEHRLIWGTMNPCHFPPLLCSRRGRKAAHTSFLNFWL